MLKNSNTQTPPPRSTRVQPALGSVGYLQAGKLTGLFVMRCGSGERIMTRENSQGGFPSIHHTHGNRQLEGRM